MVSAPLVVQSILLSGVLTMTDILFLFDVNSMTSSTSYLDIVFVNLSSIKRLLFSSRSQNVLPKCLDAFVNANSSGLDALYYSMPFLSSTIIV